MATTIVWYANNLRVDDQPALAYAARRGRVAPVFVFDHEYTGASAPGGATKWWVHHSVARLGERLGSMGSPLVIARGDPALELVRLARASGADEVVFCESIEPDLQRRDEEVEHALNQAGVEAVRCAPNLLWGVGSVLTKDGSPYQVFTPFWKAALKAGEPPAPIDAPKKLSPPRRAPGSLPLDGLGLLPQIDWAAGMRERWTPGEHAARGRLGAFIEHHLDGYAVERDRLDIPGWSAMSAHIHFGEISVRRLWHTIAHGTDWRRDTNREHYLREVGWREFAQHLLNHFPHTVDEPLREQFQGFPWVENREWFDAWRRGMTGYPVVDAAMRNLWAQGWMPNRARMIVASFLCKHLRIDWRQGAAWFWDTLVDADLGSNTLGWQWTAGCGADAAPYFRVFNPITQGQKFDPKGDYVRRWVPELAGLDARVIHAPWEAPPMELAAAGVTLGEDYPEPIVEHKAARERALAAYERVKK